MFTAIDKNLLIAALESALLYAQRSAGVSSLEDLSSNVADLRTRFDANPNDVTDAQLEAMIATLQALEIPDPGKLSRLLTTAGITDTNTYLAVCAWSTILNKPTTFPPAEHAHNWGDIAFKPATYPPAPHTHEATGGGAADWNTLANRPQTLLDISGALIRKRDPETATSWPDHPLEMGFPLPEGGTDWLSGAHFPYGARIGNTLKIAPDDSSGYIYLEVNGNNKFFSFDDHTHSPEHLFTGIMLSFPNNTWLTGRGWKAGDGTTTSRNTWLGWILSERGCPFGNGDGTTTVNVPTLIAPAGMTYYIYGDFE